MALLWPFLAIFPSTTLIAFMKLRIWRSFWYAQPIKILFDQTICHRLQISFCFHFFNFVRKKWKFTTHKWPLYDHFWPIFSQLLYYLLQNLSSDDHFERLSLPTSYGHLIWFSEIKVQKKWPLIGSKAMT